MSSGVVTGTLTSSSPRSTRPVAANEVLHRREHRAREPQNEKHRRRRRDRRRDEDVHDEVAELRLRRREARHHHPRDHVDEREDGKQLPLERELGAAELEVSGQRGSDVGDHRPQPRLHGQVVEDRRVPDDDPRCSKDHDRRPPAQVEDDRGAERDPHHQEQRLLPPDARPDVERQRHGRSPRLNRLLRRAAAADPGTHRSEPSMRARDGDRDRQRARGPRPEEHGEELARAHVDVDAQQRDAGKTERKRGEELAGHERGGITRTQPPVQPLEQRGTGTRTRDLRIIGWRVGGVPQSDSGLGIASRIADAQLYSTSRAG